MLRLLEEYNWDIQHPHILDAFAELAFDPRNTAFFEERLTQLLRYRGENPASTLKLLNTLAVQHMRTGGQPEERLSWEQLAQDPYSQVRWIVNGLCAQGSMSVLVGDAKAGKSTLIRNLLYGLTTGDTWLDRACRPVPTVYFCLEDPREVFVESMKKLYDRQGARPRLAAIAPLMLRFSVNPAQLVHDMKRDIKDGAEFFVFDTLFKILDVENEGGYVEMGMALDVLARFAKQNKIHIMVLHHRNKQSGNSGSARSMLGSTAIAASSEVNMILIRDEQSGERRIFVPDNRYPAFLSGVTLHGERVNCDQETGYTWLSRPVTKEEKKLEAKVEVYFLIAQLLRATPEGVSKKFVKDSIAKGKDTVGKVLDEGIKKGVFRLDEEQKIGGSPTVVLCPLLLAASEEELEARLKELTAKVG